MASPPEGLAEPARPDQHKLALAAELRTAVPQTVESPVAVRIPAEAEQTLVALLPAEPLEAAEGLAATEQSVEEH